MDNYSYFMQADLSGHIGEWIAICDERIVSSGSELKRVLDEAKRTCPGKKPLIAKVPTRETMIL
jgi:hypothetical protein